MNLIKQLLAIFSNQKEFTGLLGQPTANRLGLHVFRIVLSDAVCWLRTLPFAVLEKEARKSFARDGVVIIENFLDDEAFRLVRDEVRRQLNALPPAPVSTGRGFGAKIPNAQGFDRYDGGTLNRFAAISPDAAIAKHLINQPRLARLTLALFGLFNHPGKYYAYELRHGDEATNPDIQKQIHKDTFHHTYKLWYFIEDVTDELGPFAYCYGSQRTSLASLRWEYAMSVNACDGLHPNRGGSFRADAQDLQQMRLPALSPVKVPANTLVIADTKGFHRRCEGLAGSRRIGVYANFRPLAFLPLPI